MIKKIHKGQSIHSVHIKVLNMNQVSVRVRRKSTINIILALFIQFLNEETWSVDFPNITYLYC